MSNPIEGRLQHADHHRLRRAFSALRIARPHALTYAGAFALVLVLAASVIAGLCFGAYPISLAALWDSLLAFAHDAPVSTAADRAASVLVQLRAPRVALAVMVGAAFGTVGSALQALFRNPLADPGLIGVSSGAALGASLMIVFGSALFTRFGLRADEVIACAAFAGAMAVTVFVYRLGSSQGRVQLSVLLLSGIAANALAGAIIGTLSYIASDAQLRSLTFWSLGSLGSAQWRTLGAIGPFVAIGIVLIAMNAQRLNLMQLGETEALYLGVPVRRVKRVTLLAAALVVGVLVSCTGQIGFIGLVAPHCVRLACGPDLRIVLPGSALLGAILTVLADLAARTIAAPAELPLGILTALIGAPFFLLLIVNQRRLLGD